jgi:hypothetical protein
MKVMLAHFHELISPHSEFRSVFIYLFIQSKKPLIIMDVPLDTTKCS